MRIYAISMSATILTDVTKVYSMALAHCTDQPDERIVRENIMAQCYKQFPVSEGFVRHAISVVLVPDEYVKSAANSIGQYDIDTMSISDIWKE